EYQEEYKSVFSKYGLSNVFLITPQTTQNRIREIDAMTSGAFIYAVSSASITGAKTGISATQEEYLARLKDMGLNNPFLVGFGIADHKAFAKVSEYAAGAIIGSAFINRLKENRNNLTESVVDFVKKIKNQNQ
ncbi:MAG: tryptophan synthase subunit alpha, partial [Cyclobacteriaceae bacterium]|nr:tryptophan synthase subunit alpha [Cyclobacteriaceae bacterium]